MRQEREILQHAVRLTLAVAGLTETRLRLRAIVRQG